MSAKETGSAATPGAYRWWLASDTSAAIGGGLRGFILPLLTLTITGSAVHAGLVSTVQGLLTQVFLIGGGVIIDRFDRRILIRLHSAVNAVALLLLAVLAWGGQLGLAALLSAAVVFGLVAGLFGEASDAALRSVIDAERYPKAVTVNEGRDAAIRLATGPVGGWLLGVMAGASLLVSSVFYILAGVLIGRVPLKLPPRDATLSPLAQLTEALSWIRARRRAVPLVLLVGMANFGIAGVMTTTQYLAVQRTGQALDAGLLTTAAGLSVIVGALLANPIVSRMRTGTLIPVAFTLIAVGVAGLSVFNQGVPLVVLLVLTFLGVPALNAALTGFFFAATPEAMQGRVQALLGTFAAGLGALAPLTVGLVLQLVDAQTAYFVALGPMAAALVLAIGARSIREIPRPDDWASIEL